MEYNLKIQVSMGLQKDWGVFNLYGAGEANAYEHISIEIMTDGDSYVENTAASISHAASSQYKELETILPLVTQSDGSTTWEITKYGSKFKEMISKYYPIQMATAGGDLWSQASSYTDYVNQFNVTFLESPFAYDALEDGSKDQWYYDYKALVKSYAGRHYLKKLFSELSGSNGIKANIDLLHFSKYYNTYAPSTVPVPTLRSLVYDETSMDKFNLCIDNGKAKINNLLLMTIYSDDSEEQFALRNIELNSNGGYNWRNNNATISMWRGVHNGMTMFKQCPQPDAEYPYLSEEDKFYNFMPSGFSLLALWERSGIYNGDNKTHSDAYRNKKLPQQYLNYFLLGNNDKYAQKCINECEPALDKLLMTLVYFGDQLQNFRIFNSYFPVNKGDQVVSDVIQYKSVYQGKKPETIGMALVSVLTSIYAYSGDDDPKDITYISDCVFLSLNTTIYAKDMVYKASVIEGTDKQKMLLFHKVPFQSYVDTVIAAALKDKTIDHVCTAKNFNVTPEINSCIKNIPIQININYIEPNIEAVGVIGNQTRVYQVNGTYKNIRNWKPEANTLYQLTTHTDGTVAVDRLGSNFTIRYLKSGSLKYEDEKLVAEYDSNIPAETNSYLEKVFMYDESGLGFKHTYANGQIDKYYSFSTERRHRPAFGSNYSTFGTLKFMPKDDVLIPFAKMILQ